MTTAAPTSRKVPAKALRFSAPCQFADRPAESDGKSAPITIFARSAEPVEHWYWGRCVHDMSGMSLRKDRCPLDYEHSSWTVIGFADQFDAGDDGLTVSGQLVSFRDDDLAAEVMWKGQHGVPYEASIDFDPGKLLIEEIGEGFTALVNGQQMEGPLTIFRQWELRGVAIARYGQDSATRTAFTEQSQDEIDVQIMESESMAKQAAKPEATDPAATPAEKAPVVENPAAPETSTEFSAAETKVKAELAKFTTLFGADLGVQYFSEGKPFAEACTQFIQHQAAELAKRDEQITKLSQQLAAIDTGEIAPAQFSDGGEPQDKEPKDEVPSKFSSLPSGLGRFAAGIKLPTKAK